MLVERRLRKPTIRGITFDNALYSPKCGQSAPSCQSISLCTILDRKAGDSGSGSLRIIEADCGGKPPWPPGGLAVAAFAGWRGRLVCDPWRRAWQVSFRCASAGRRPLLRLERAKSAPLLSALYKKHGCRESRIGRWGYRGSPGRYRELVMFAADCLMQLAAEKETAGTRQKRASIFAKRRRQNGNLVRVGSRVTAGPLALGVWQKALK